MKIVPKKIACTPPHANTEAPDTRAVEGAEADEELAGLAKAIGHPARVQIMRLLVRREACICGDIVDELPLAQSTVSQHLKVLKDGPHPRRDRRSPRLLLRRAARAATAQGARRQPLGASLMSQAALAAPARTSVARSLSFLDR
jgi:ArsR family transcriptional regulator